VKVAAIVVNYRTAELTARVVTALLAELDRFEGAHVFLVDNASGDDSLPYFRQAALRDGWGTRVTLVASERNGGYGYGINLAVLRAQEMPEAADYFYVLNSDAFADPGTVARLVDYLDAHPQTGIAGGRIHDPDGVTLVTAFRFPNPLGELETMVRTGVLSQLLRAWIVSMPEPQSSGEVDWVSGTSMLIRRCAFEELGGFDEGFFLYFEETDFCHSARLRGWKTAFVKDAPVTHLGSVSTGVSNHTRRIPRYWFESRHRYLRKHSGLAYTVLCDCAWLLGLLIWRLRTLLKFRPAQNRPRLLRDFLASSFRDLLGGRKP